jgi:cytidylate kinase
MPGVTISAGYGAGGSVVAPAVAERLGVQLLDRTISSAVAAQLDVSQAEAEAGTPRRSVVERLLSFMSPLASDALATNDLDPLTLTDEGAAFREEAERIMRVALASGAVILGRAGAAAFRDAPDVLRVRLFGPLQARIQQAAIVEQVDVEVARQRIANVDGARDQYVRRLYRISVDEPDVFHLQLDSTALPLPTCIDLIVSAYQGLLARRAAGSDDGALAPQL